MSNYELKRVESKATDQRAHYSIFKCVDDKGMEFLKDILGEEPQLDEMNFVLFSTSGVHGCYTTIEQAEKEYKEPFIEDGKVYPTMVTFLHMRPRMVTVVYGNCQITCQEDIEYLKKVRERSMEAIELIGY